MIWKTIDYSDFYTNFSVKIPAAYIWTPVIVLKSSSGETKINISSDSSLAVTPEGYLAAEINEQLISSCDIVTRRSNFDLSSVHTT